MKRLLILLAAMSAFSLQSNGDILTRCFNGKTVTDVYDLKLKVGVPRIYNNTTSKGYRKYQWQLLVGELHITYRVYDDGTCVDQPTISVVNLVNKTHKINGKSITYKCTVNNSGEMYEGPITRVNAIGSNATDVFEQASVCFFLDAEPSYNVGEDDEDNSLLITLGGYGVVKKTNWFPYVCSSTYYKYHTRINVISKLRGFFGGTLGCGCKAYGHKSPTRVMGYLGPTDTVDDVASVFGQWVAHFKERR